MYSTYICTICTEHRTNMPRSVGSLSQLYYPTQTLWSKSKWVDADWGLGQWGWGWGSVSLCPCPRLEHWTMLSVEPDSSICQISNINYVIFIYPLEITGIGIIIGHLNMKLELGTWPTGHVHLERDGGIGKTAITSTSTIIRTQFGSGSVDRQTHTRITHFLTQFTVFRILPLRWRHSSISTIPSPTLRRNCYKDGNLGRSFRLEQQRIVCTINNKESNMNLEFWHLTPKVYLIKHE